MGLPSPKKVVTNFENGTPQGFDVIHSSILSGIFGISFEMIDEFDLKELFDSGEFKPEDYGIHVKMHKPFTTKVSFRERAITKPYHTTVKRKMTKAWAYFDKQSQLEAINVFDVLRETNL